MANVQCWVCFGYGHTGKNCPKKGKGKGGDKKGGGKGKGKSGGFKGKGKGKGKSFNSMEEEKTSVEEVYGNEDGSWDENEEYPGWLWNDDVEDWLPTQGCGGQDFGALDLNALDPSALSQYRVRDSYGQEWLKINYDSGAATTAIPVREADGADLVKVGSFKGAGGTGIDNFGRFKVPAEDEDGYQRDFKAFVADIHKPLGSAAEFSETHDGILWHDGGALLPRKSPIAVGLRKEYWRLKALYGDCHEIPLYREGQLYNFYLKRRGALTKLSSVELSAQEEGGEAVDAGAELFSGNPRQARQL